MDIQASLQGLREDLRSRLNALRPSQRLLPDPESLGIGNGALVEKAKAFAHERPILGKALDGMMPAQQALNSGDNYRRDVEDISKSTPVITGGFRLPK